MKNLREISLNSGEFNEAFESDNKSDAVVHKQDNTDVVRDTVEVTELVVPDGGWGWLVLFGAMMVNILIPGGALKSFGILFVEFIEYFEASPTSASWIPALCYFLYCGLGPLSSIMSARFSYRTTTIVGGLFATVGMILTYWASSITYLYISYGILVGIGCGLSYPPTIYIVNSYFSKWRGIANGFCTSGSAIGSIILPPILRILLHNYGYRITCVILGCMISLTLLAAIFYDPVEKHMKKIVKTVENPEKNGKLDSICKKYIDTKNNSVKTTTTTTVSQTDPETDKKPKESTMKKYFDVSLMCDPVYLIILVSSSMNAIGYTNFIISLPSYGLTLGFDKDFSAYLLSIVSSFDLIGRVSGCALSDINFIPKSWYFIGGLGLSGVSLALLPLFKEYFWISVFCSIFGLGTGCYVGITPVIMADMLGIERLTSSYGISLFVTGILQLIGPPICLAFYEHVGSYQMLFIILGSSLLAGALLWLLMPMAKQKNKQNI